MHFVNWLSSRGGISRERRHLLIVDGHNLHVTLDVVMKAMDVGLDLLTFPSYMTHRLQPLDVSIFAPFKKYFRRYRDAWIMKNRGRDACKEILAMWISLELQRALTPSNILAGFRGTGIWPLNPGMVEKYLGPAHPFEHAEVESTDGSAPGSGDVRLSCEDTLSHWSGQVRESNEAAGNGSDVGGSAAPSEPVDGGDSAEGPDEALVALLQSLVPERHYGRQHFVVTQAKVSTALGCRSPSPSSGFSSEADGPQSPRTGAGDFDVDSADAPRGTVG